MKTVEYAGKSYVVYEDCIIDAFRCDSGVEVWLEQSEKLVFENLEAADVWLRKNFDAKLVEDGDWLTVQDA